MIATRADPSGDGAKSRSSAADMAQQVGDEAKTEARRLRDEALDGARRQAEDKKAAAGAYLQTVAAAVSSGAEAFRRDGRDGTGSLLDRAADEIGHVAERLADRGPEEILRDVEGFARRHPAVFFGSACLLAFGAARLLKSSRPDRMHGTDATYGAIRGSDPGPTSIATPPGGSAGASPTARTSSPAAPSAGSSAGAATPVMGGSAAVPPNRGTEVL